MRIAILHNAVGDAAAPDDRDVLVQAGAVEAALSRLGHGVRVIPCDLNLEALSRDLSADRPDLAFNLAESLGGHGRLIHLVPTLLDALGVPYTGAPAEGMLRTSGKVMAKAHMAGMGIPTPAWWGPIPQDGLDGRYGPVNGDLWIIKSVWEHASIGLDETGLVRPESPEDLRARIASRLARLAGAGFAEKYIAGREFNLSILGGPEGPRVLPPAEILFEGFPDGAPRIVDYAAKWDENAHAYHHTPRRFDFPAEDAPLLSALADLALRCWHAFGLRGYARVDFRVDGDGRPWVLEVNANPCLSPDAGFAAALHEAGISFDAAVARILADTPTAAKP